MTQLNCQVTVCAHYNSGYCCKQEILIDGENARQKEQTSCESYYPMTASYQDSIECESSDPKQSIQVQCNAQKCYYNQDLICSADHINIGGQHADTRDETLCTTFKTK